MTIITNVTFSDFRDAFSRKGRESQFSSAGFRALFDWLEEYSENTVHPHEPDVIGLCCYFAEYGSLEELQDDYISIESMDDLRRRTTIIEFDGGLIVQAF